MEHRLLGNRPTAHGNPLTAILAVRAAATSKCHTVLACGSGREALEIVPRYRPDLVLLDIGMPDLDGLATARLIRSQLPPETIPRIVALTGWGQEADRLRTRDAGIDEHLVKPVSSEALRELLAS